MPLELIIALLLILLGFVAGTFGALLGLGGSVLLVPLLALIGMPMGSAVGTGLLCVIATSSSAAAVYVRRGWVDVRLGILLELSTILGAVTGAVLAAQVPDPWLKGLFGAFLLYAAAMLWARPPAEDDDAGDAVPEYSVRRTPLGLGVSYVAGSVSGLLGIGGGPIQVPLMHLAMGVPLKAAAATSNFMMGVTAAAGAFLYFARGQVLVALTVPLVLGVFAGAQAGAWLARRVCGRWLRLLLILVLVALAALMLSQAFGIPVSSER